MVVQGARSWWHGGDINTEEEQEKKQRWWLGEKEVGKTGDYKYLWVWMLKGHVHLERQLIL